MKAAKERRDYLLKLARANLKFAEAQLRDPSLRPDVSLRLSADQYRAVAEFLSAKPDAEKRGRWFAAMAETADRGDWPSSAVAPFRVFTQEEATAIWNGPRELHQRVFAPYLTATEQAALRQSAKEAMVLMRKAFSENNS